MTDVLLDDTVYDALAGSPDDVAQHDVDVTAVRLSVRLPSNSNASQSTRIIGGILQKMLSQLHEFMQLQRKARPGYAILSVTLLEWGPQPQRSSCDIIASKQLANTPMGCYAWSEPVCVQKCLRRNNPGNLLRDANT